MKKFSFYILLIAFLIPSPLFAQEKIKVTVIPSVLNMFIQYSTLEGVLKEENGILDKTIKAFQENIIQSGYAYSTASLESDDKEASRLIDEGLYPTHRERFDADILILIGNANEGEDIEVFLVGTETSRGYSYFIKRKEINNENFAALLNQAISEGLKKVSGLLLFDADKIVDPEKSIVQYRLPSQADDVVVNIDYDQTHEQIDNVYIFIEEDKSDGRYDFELASLDGHKITLTYRIEGGAIKSVDIITDFDNLQELAGQTKNLIVKSRNGHTVNFQFSWDENQAAKVKVVPSLNPYLPHLL